MSDTFSQVVHSSIWEEEAREDNPYVAEACYCRGYDVYGDLLGKASYIEYLHLLFRGERPAPQAAAALEVLALALANPGPRDPSVHAAMAAGVGGSTSASALMAALACGAGSCGGAREVFLFLETWTQKEGNTEAWCDLLRSPPSPTRARVWPEAEHPPGFEPYGTQCAAPVLHTLSKLLDVMPGNCLQWLSRNRNDLEAAAGRPLSLMAVAAATLADLGFSAAEAEMLTLLLRLPGAAAHALEQGRQGFRRFPFFELALENDPGAAHATEEKA